MSTCFGKPLNSNHIADVHDLKEGLRHTVSGRSQVVDSKRRDVGVVDRARLENESGASHEEMLNHFFAQVIQRLPATECFSM
jgi:hypothetical protein